MPGNNQRRQVLVDEEFYQELLAQAQTPQERQALAPILDSVPREYRAYDETSLNNNDRFSGYLDDAQELDLNRNRNDIAQETFGVSL